MLSEFELKKIEKAVGGFIERRRPPVHMRKEVDIGYRVSGHSVEIFEVRPDWQDPAQEMKHSVAKVRYVRSANEWRLYWMRQDLKWHSYEPHAVGRSLEELVEAVDRDELCCFFG